MNYETLCLFPLILLAILGSFSDAENKNNRKIIKALILGWLVVYLIIFVGLEHTIEVNLK